MRAAVLHGARDLRVDEHVVEPVPGRGDVLVRVLVNGICGSDLTIWRRGKPEPVILGHEIAAEILTGPDAGRIAAVNQGNNCGSCARCDAGLEHYCQSATGLGAVRFGGTFGGLGELVAAPADRVIAAPAGMDPGLIALSEPLGNALRTLDCPEAADASSAVVVGAGPIGLALVAALSARAIPTILAVEGRPQRAEMARALGALEVIDPMSDVEAEVRARLPLGAELVVEAAGKSETIEVAGRLARPGGTLFLQGIPLEPHPLRLWDWTSKELTVRTSVGLSVDDHRRAIQMIHAHRDVPWHELVTRRVPLEGAPEAFADLDAGADEVKVLIEVAQ